MNQKCNIAITCPCLDSNPVANFSSGLPDAQVFVGRGFAYVSPKLGELWGQTQCQTLTQSSSSITAAQLLAYSQAVQCVAGTFSNPATFMNTQQQATSPCPDGLLFTYTVPAGAFVSASSQLDANTQAQTYAQQQATARKICLGSLPSPYACIGTGYSQPITATGNFLAQAPATDTWAISGSVPPGLSLSSTMVSGGVVYLMGTPTTVGSYTFNISVTDPGGDTMSKSYTLNIAGISNANSLPSPNKFFFYSQALATFGLASPTFALASGSLPAGLSLSASGVISGTPTGSGISTFGVTATDGVSGLACTSSVTLNVTAVCALPQLLVTSAALATDNYTKLAYRSTSNTLFVLDFWNPAGRGVYEMSMAGTIVQSVTGAGSSDGTSSKSVVWSSVNDVYLVCTQNSNFYISKYDPTTLLNVNNAAGNGFNGNSVMLDCAYNTNNNFVYSNGYNRLLVLDTTQAGAGMVLATLLQTNPQENYAGKVTFDFPNKLMFVGYQINHNSPASPDPTKDIGNIYVYDTTNTLPVRTASKAVPQGAGGSQICDVYFCPDNNSLYCSYSKKDAGFNVISNWIGVFNATTGVLITEIQITDSLTLVNTNPNNGLYYTPGAVYNPSSKLMFFCFDTTVQVVCTANNAVVQTISAKAQDAVYVASNQRVYFLDVSGVNAVLKGYG